MDQLQSGDVGSLALDVFGDAYAGYAAALQHLGLPEDLERRAATAYAALAEAMQRAAPPADAQREVEDANAVYVGIIAEALDDEAVRAGFAAAARDYVASVRKAWAELAPDELDADAIGGLGQQLAAVAWMMKTGQAPELKRHEAS